MVAQVAKNLLQQSKSSGDEQNAIVNFKQLHYHRAAFAARTGRGRLEELGKIRNRLRAMAHRKHRPDLLI